MLTFPYNLLLYALVDCWCRFDFVLLLRLVRDSLHLCILFISWSTIFNIDILVECKNPSKFWFVHVLCWLNWIKTKSQLFKAHWVIIISILRMLLSNERFPTVFFQIERISQNKLQSSENTIFRIYLMKWHQFRRFPLFQSSNLTKASTCLFYGMKQIREKMLHKRWMSVVCKLLVCIFCIHILWKMIPIMRFSKAEARLEKYKTVWIQGTIHDVRVKCNDIIVTNAAPTHMQAQKHPE